MSSPGLGSKILTAYPLSDPTPCPQAHDRRESTSPSGMTLPLTNDNSSSSHCRSSSRSELAEEAAALVVVGVVVGGTCRTLPGEEEEGSVLREGKESIMLV